MVKHFLLLALLLPTPNLLRAETAAGVNTPGNQAVLLATKALHAAGIFNASPIAPSRPLPDCDGAIAAAPRQGKWSTITLRCDSPRWTRALRTRTTASASTARLKTIPEQPTALARQALVLTHSLGKGDVIGPGDVTLIPVSDQTADQVFTDPARLIGRRLKQAISPGKPISPRHLETNWLVEKGAPVTIMTQTGGISVSTQGRALENAAFGDLVPVVALSSGRTLAARVVDTDIVSIRLKPFKKTP